MLEPHKEIVNGCEFWMLPVQGGTYFMGSLKGDSEAHDDEKPQHKVTVSDFYFSKFPVTQALWKAVMNSENPSYFQGDDRPVEQVSWDDITEKFLPAFYKMTGHAYRLPTEAEWEYAARGGKFYMEGYKYAGSDRLKDVGWFNENSGGETKPVGLKYPNQLGIHDMSGNVWEWCEDDWHENYKGAPEDGSAWIDSPRGARRVPRGGSWNFIERLCSATTRYGESLVSRVPNIGFRLVLAPQSVGRPVPAFL